MARKRLSKDDREFIQDATEEVLKNLLRFRVSHDIMAYIRERADDRWPDLEEELHNNYPIKSVELTATRRNLSRVNAADGGFQVEIDVSPEFVTDFLQDFPLGAAAAAYCFTILEGFGDELVSTINPQYANKHKSWRRNVYGDLDLSDPKALEKARRAFAKPFNSDVADVPMYAVERLVKLKKHRNEFMHEGSSSSLVFEEFFGSVLATVCQLFFVCTRSRKELRISLFT
jgi:hypothetical protein